MPSQRGRRLVVEGSTDSGHFLRRISKFAEGLQSAESWDDLRRQMPEILHRSVSEMEKLFIGQDVFDILDLVRQHETPIVLDGYRESQAEGMVAVIEIVALVALGLGARKVPVVDGAGSESVLPANQVIEPLCNAGRQVVKLAALLSMADGASHENPLGELAGQLRSSELMIRGKHYQSIGAILYDGVFNAPQLQVILEAAAGYTFADVSSVADAVRHRYQDVKIGLRDNVGSIVQEYGSVDNLPGAVAEEARRLLIDFLISPGESSSFTAVQISDRSGVHSTESKRC